MVIGQGSLMGKMGWSDPTEALLLLLTEAGQDTQFITEYLRIILIYITDY